MRTQHSSQSFSSSTTTETYIPSIDIKKKLDEPPITEENIAKVDQVYATLQKCRRALDPTTDEKDPHRDKLKDFFEEAVVRVRLFSILEESPIENEESRQNKLLKTINNNPSIFDGIDFLVESSKAKKVL